MSCGIIRTFSLFIPENCEDKGLFPHTLPHEEEAANCPRLRAAAISPVGILPLGSAFQGKREKRGCQRQGSRWGQSAPCCLTAKQPKIQISLSDFLGSQRVGFRAYPSWRVSPVALDNPGGTASIPLNGKLMATISSFLSLAASLNVFGQHPILGAFGSPATGSGTLRTRNDEPLFQPPWSFQSEADHQGNSEAKI